LLLLTRVSDLQDLPEAHIEGHGRRVQPRQPASSAARKGARRRGAPAAAAAGAAATRRGAFNGAEELVASTAVDGELEEGLLARRL
jgi:hypothetical protein